MAARGELRVPVSRTFTLDEANAALAEQATRQSRGKLVILVQPEA
jgi:NADPH:quinone reductase-like Zn-dependent oxidoreductase